MKPLKALIIDDEFHCRETLNQLIGEFVPEIKVVALANSASAARDLFKMENPDLIFLDIKMPKENGFDFLNSIDSSEVSVIFTTAHNEYAIDAIRANAIDYLEKPINIDDLMEAVNRVIEKKKSDLPEISAILEKIQSTRQDKVSIPTKDGFVYVNSSEIIHLEASDSYTYIYLTENRKYLSSKNIKVFENHLNGHSFFRVHKSHIINLKDHLREFKRSDGNQVLLSEGRSAPVSRRKLSDFLSRINGYAQA